eukprot:356925-Chlamydomonas_euryale.AAC.12
MSAMDCPPAGMQHRREADVQRCWAQTCCPCLHTRQARNISGGGQNVCRQKRGCTAGGALPRAARWTAGNLNINHLLSKRSVMS